MSNSENDITKRRFTLRKPEKLRHKAVITSLFNDGETIYDYPLRLSWLTMSAKELRNSFCHEVPPCFGKMQMLITIPKKKRKHAVDRVLMRRRIREAYRLNRLELADVINKREEIGVLALAFIYMAPENISYSKIEKKMKALLDKIKNKVSDSSDSGKVIETGNNKE